MRLKQLIPQEFCLNCKACCRFTQPDTIWAPLFTDSEIRDLVERDKLPPALFSHQQAHGSGACRIHLVQHGDGFVCPCLNDSDQKCKIYADRPGDCQLYPFLLASDKGRYYLAYHKECPYLKSGPVKEIKSYIEYLKQEFQKKTTLEQLRQNKGLFCEYPLAEIEILLAINL